jgi:hypothetical protein
MGRMPERALLVLILAAGLGVRLIDVVEPWVGLKDFTGALHGQIAKNYVQFGYLGTLLGPVTNFEPHPEQFTYYLHHPILFNILLSLPMHFLGTAEWVVRLLPILSSLVGIFLLFLLVRMLWGTERALAASAFMAVAPMCAFFGRMPNEETLALTVIIGIALLYLRAMRRADHKLGASFYSLLIAGLFTAWPVYYTAGFLALHLFFSRRRHEADRGRALTLLLLAVAAFGVFLLHGQVLTGHLGGNLPLIFLERAGAVTDLMAKGSYAKVIPAWFVSYFTPVMIILTGIFLADTLVRKAERPRGGGTILFGLYLIAITHIIIFREGAQRHEFWLYYFAAPLAITSSLGFFSLIRLARARVVMIVLSLAVWGTFLAMSFTRTISVFAVDKFEDIPELGRWLQSAMKEDEELLVVGPSLARFGYSPMHFDYYHGPVYTWPMPHIGYYTQRKIRWGIRDMSDLAAIAANPGKITYAVMTEEYTDALVSEAREFLTRHGEEIPPEMWSKNKSASTLLFTFRKEEPALPE